MMYLKYQLVYFNVFPYKLLYKIKIMFRIMLLDPSRTDAQYMSTFACTILFNMIVLHHFSSSLLQCVISDTHNELCLLLFIAV